jgi:aryl-alcohol dehydrogenase-like predicted oxidoreductase
MAIADFVDRCRRVNYRRLGAAGLKLSELSLGSWVTYGGQVGEEVAVKCMSIAL